MFMRTIGDIEPGQDLMLGCQGCRRWFRWTTTENWHAEIPTYHSHKCKERRRIRLQRMEFAVKCPRIEKRLYRTDAEAQTEAIRMSRQYSQPFSAYRCVCGGLHIGRMNYRHV